MMGFWCLTQFVDNGRIWVTKVFKDREMKYFFYRITEFCVDIHEGKYLCESEIVKTL